MFTSLKGTRKEIKLHIHQKNETQLIPHIRKTHQKKKKTLNVPFAI